MIIGNQEARKLLHTYIDPNKTIPSFIILHGPKNVGKSSMIQELAHELLGNFFQNDFLYIQDCSQYLGKRHSIKIESDPSTEDYKTMLTECKFQDLGVREINARLQRSPSQKYKILLIEDIERMTNEASNAFLKTCEEALPNRIIIATTPNTSKVIDTILSRAVLIKCSELPYNEMLQYAQSNDILNADPKLQEFVCHMAMGRPGVLLYLKKILEANEDLQKDFSVLIDLLKNTGGIHKTQNLLAKLHEHGFLDQFLDGRIAYCANNGMSIQSENRLKTKKMLQNNINVEHVLLYGLLQ